MKRFFSVALIIVLGSIINLSFSITPSFASLAEGLIAYYPFNGNAIDESDKDNNGTVHGATLTVD